MTRQLTHSRWITLGAIALTVVTLITFRVFRVDASEPITRIWLTHRSNDPSQLVINWETSEPGNSIVHYGLTPAYGKTMQLEQSVTLHHVEIPLSKKDVVYHYQVQTGSRQSSDATFKAYPTDTLRVAVAANWTQRSSLEALKRENVHLMLTAGEQITDLYQLCGFDVKDCTEPFGRLIDTHADFFRSTPFMPVLGNHDRQVRPTLGRRYRVDPIYDIEATAFRKFFPLPDQGWKWQFTVPEFGARFIALDLNHTYDAGTPWQSSHSFQAGSVQYAWYRDLIRSPNPGFVITLHNERNLDMRILAQPTWHELFRQGTLTISGFTGYAERAKVEGFPYYTTHLVALKTADRFIDPDSVFFKIVDNYLLMTFTPQHLTAELKNLAGEVLDRQHYPNHGSF
ncbi:MAG: hypothetical protein ACRC8A_02240 [Microcoleaceae cyanobacterium]